MTDQGIETIGLDLARQRGASPLIEGVEKSNHVIVEDNNSFRAQHVPV